MNTITKVEGEDIIAQIFETLTSDQEHQNLIEDIAVACDLSQDDLRSWIEKVRINVDDVNLKP